jgi:acetamidase/formamidase
MLRAGLAIGLLLGSPAAYAAPTAPVDWTGPWNLVARFAGGGSAAVMTLARGEGGAVTGTTGPLDEVGTWPLVVSGREAGGRLVLTLSRGTLPVGTLTLRPGKDGLAGEGALYGVAVTVEGARNPERRAPKTHDFAPATFQTRYSPDAPPVLHVAPGDTIRTTTLDNEGRDAGLVWRGMPGNTLTGPFYVDGAMPGDTLAIRFDRVALNRDTAKMASGRLSARAVQAGYLQTPRAGWDSTWKLDRERNEGRPVVGGKLSDFVLPLEPMIGSIGVAPPGAQALAAGDLGFHGGNLDYSRLTTGATLYLPVFRAGALLSFGDGHALQGDGEITGQGLETSLDVTLTVELIKGRSLGQPWSEDAEFVMVSGVDNTLDEALKMATSGLARWVKERYGLDDSEIAAVLGASVAYDIAEVVDPRPHVVARISKKTLAMLPARAAPIAP